MEQAKVPRHVGFIMDGNGRWAKARGRPRTFGHEAGYEKVKEIARWCKQRGVAVVTFYAFSTENWKRPKLEVAFLMGLIRLVLRRDVAELHQEGIRLRVVGDREGLEPDLVSVIAEAERQAATGDFTLQVAFNYGGRREIVRAAQHIIRAGVSADQIDEASFARFLPVFDPKLAAGLDLDLVIRTGGERRLSGFMLWWASYAELYFTDVLWPDFSGTDLDAALAWYSSRQRKFGAVPDAKL